MAYTTLEKFMEFFGGGIVKVSDPGDGTLLWTTPWGEWRFVEVEPLYFRQVDANFSIAFREDDGGHITHLFSDLTPMYTFERLAWYETPGFNMALLVGCILIFLSTIAAAAIGAIRNRRLGGDRSPAPRGARVAKWIILGICVLNVLFVVGFYLWINPRPMFGVSIAGQSYWDWAFCLPCWQSARLRCWPGKSCGVFRPPYALVTVAVLCLVPNYWNLLGWQF
jgi:hypothetical protein